MQCLAESLTLTAAPPTPPPPPLRVQVQVLEGPPLSPGPTSRVTLTRPGPRLGGAVAFQWAGAAV